MRLNVGSSLGGGPKTGHTTGTPPRIAAGPSIDALLDVNNSSVPSTAHEYTVAPCRATLTSASPLEMVTVEPSRLTGIVGRQ